MPKGVVLLATPEGWRHSVLTADGGTVCGRLAGVPAGADPAEARASRRPWSYDSHATSTQSMST